MKNKNISKLILLLTALLLTACGQNKQSSKQNEYSEALADSTFVQTAKEAYAFGLPLVLMDLTRRKMTDAAMDKYAAAPNTFAHRSEFPDASFRDVVRPNADTYYSTASLDLSKEPVILSVPDTHGRYYMMPMLDAYTNVFASPGTRTTGNKARNFLITGPGWQGETPANIESIKAPTNMVWIIGRTQVNSQEDGLNVVVPLQKHYKLTPLSRFGKTFIPPVAQADPTVPKGSPNDIVKSMPIDSFFNYINKLMIDNPPAAADEPVMKKFASIGVRPGGTFDMSKQNTATQEEIRKIPAEVFSVASQYFQKSHELVNGWNPMRGTQGNYGTDYQTRALVAIGGLGANLREDAMYPSAGSDSDGNMLNGLNNYVLHFEKGKTPPANAFWSLTLYDNDGYMVANALNRNAVGDRSNLKKNADGSIDIYIQNASPGKDKERNWLPAPKGDFNVLLRVYWPKESMLNGSWSPPGIKKVNP